MKTSRKLAVTLAVFAAGFGNSVFYGSLPAQAKGIELDEVKIVVRGHHGEMPPPPEHRRHMPPPEFRRHRGHMPPPEFRRHHRDVPSPPPPHHDRHGYRPPHR